MIDDFNATVASAIKQLFTGEDSSDSAANVTPPETSVRSPPAFDSTQPQRLPDRPSDPPPTSSHSRTRRSSIRFTRA